jgi:FKBP-type peptidyl-prolyl cis-trans isomerase
MNLPVARRGNTSSAQLRRHGSTPFAVAMLATAVALAGWGSVRAADQAPAAKPAQGAATKGAATKKAAAPAAAGAADAANPKSAASYSVGVSMGEQLHRFGLGPEAISMDRIMAGIRDGMSGKAKMSDADQQNIATLIKAARAGQVDANHAIADKFLAENGKKADVKTTASGLQYKVISAGNASANSPKPTDEVTVNYAGRLLDGTEFDSSYKRGQPATFPVNGVIPGWTEALQLMKPGSKFQLFIPPKLAYDANVPPGAEIPPGSLLVFDVELMSVKAPAATPPSHPAIPPPQPQK